MSAPMCSNGQWIQCSACGGYGVVSGYTLGGTDFTGPEECGSCANGQIWQYPSGALAQYPGGPFVGRTSKESENSDASSVQPETPDA